MGISILFLDLPIILKLIYPFINQDFHPFGEDFFDVGIKLRNPDVKIRDISSDEIINNFLNFIQFFGECFLIDWTVIHR